MGDNKLEESLKKYVPDSKVVMGRAKRGIYAGRHIQFGNRVSEDGGNNLSLAFLNDHFNIIYSLSDVGPFLVCLMSSKTVKQYPWMLHSIGGDGHCPGTRRSWKPNVQEKRLFSYILDRHIRVKVTTHALRCIDKAGGIDEYLLKTPYHKMDTEMGLFWKAKIEKMYEELGEMDVVFFSPEDEVKFEQGFKELKLAERAARREARRQIYGGSGKQVQLEEGGADIQETNEVAARVLEGSSHVDAPEQLVANT
ncbi:hypothetical protein CK203_019908 [Vitis vinifera]|uniref:Large ribosomal subunit protein bL28m n=1 Tax=Vitis vinifera TaxID=29760 RepID=A0A438J2X1_VITVI|nr:hypothetical protein CK203_019908 [Vitis vinifera]